MSTMGSYLRFRSPFLYFPTLETYLVPTVLENPSVLLTSLRFFLGSKVGKVEDFTNLNRNKNRQEISENEYINGTGLRQ
jgi:hypothetical protein